MLKILFTYPEVVPNEINLIHHLMSDWDYLHIKKEDMDADEMTNYLELIDQRHHQNIILHNHFQLLKDFNLGGVALNQHNVHLHETFEGLKCSYSAHSIEEIENLEVAFDHIFLSPIYTSISKPNYGPSFTDRAQLKESLAQINAKVIALGGVNEAKMDEIKDLGFSGYAMLGGVWEQHLQAKEWG